MSKFKNSQDIIDYLKNIMKERKEEQGKKFEKLTPPRQGKCTNCLKFKTITHVVTDKIHPVTDKLWEYQGEERKTIGYLCKDCAISESI